MKGKILAIYTTLPIYKATYDFLLACINATSHFPREYKYTLGEKLQKVAVDLVVLIYKANVNIDKVQYLEKMQEEIQLLYLFLRVSHDIKILPTEKYARIVKMIDDISKQVTGWLSSNRKNKVNSEYSEFAIAKA